MSVILMSVALPVLGEGAETEEVSSFFRVTAARESSIRVAETWRINRSGIIVVVQIVSKRCSVKALPNKNY